ncbi:MAG: hypothetical protein WCS20_16750 [Alphaproteobacteria bacterium]
MIAILLPFRTNCWSRQPKKMQIQAEQTTGEQMRQSCTSTVMLDDPQLRATRFDFAPGAETGWHIHGLDYVITAVTDCPMLIEELGGAVRRVLVPAGTAYRRDRGVQHNVINDGPVVMTFVEVELKQSVMVQDLTQ